MKAQLTIEMPTDCNECLFIDFSLKQCKLAEKNIDNFSVYGTEIPDWCFLKPIKVGNDNG